MIDIDDPVVRLISFIFTAVLLFLFLTDIVFGDK